MDGGKTPARLARSVLQRGTTVPLSDTALESGAGARISKPAGLSGANQTQSQMLREPMQAITPLKIRRFGGKSGQWRNSYVFAPIFLPFPLRLASRSGKPSLSVESVPSVVT